MTDRKGYVLVDAQQQHAAHPDTFWVPDLAAIAKLCEGSYVKLIFRRSRNPVGERMWVKIQGATGRKYIGTLQNNPFVLADVLAVGDTVSFEARHIIGIMDDAGLRRVAAGRAK